MARYVRTFDLPRILPVSSALLNAPARDVAELLRRALEVEKARAVSGHWTHYPSRHAALMDAYRAEQLQADVEADRAADAALDRLEVAAEIAATH